MWKLPASEIRLTQHSFTHKKHADIICSSSLLVQFAYVVMWTPQFSYTVAFVEIFRKLLLMRIFIRSYHQIVPSQCFHRQSWILGTILPFTPRYEEIALKMCQRRLIREEEASWKQCCPVAGCIRLLNPLDLINKVDKRRLAQRNSVSLYDDYRGNHCLSPLLTLFLIELLSYRLPNYKHIKSLRKVIESICYYVLMRILYI